MTGLEETQEPLSTDCYKALVDHMPNGVIVLFDADLRYKVVGPKMLPFSGRRAADMVDKHIEELFPEATVEILRPELEATIEDEPRSFDIEFEDRVHHIETRPVSLDGNSSGVLLTQDVTEERETAIALEENNERLDHFTSMLSHDIKNPLSIATGHLDLYRETGDDSHLEAVQEGLDRIEEIVIDLAGLARYGSTSTDLESVSIPEIADTAWKHVNQRSATLKTTEATITGDRGQLQVLLENLFRNAIGHGGDDVEIRVGPIEDGFYVEDNGSGIPPEEREKIFEHNFSTGYGGRGVGLTIVQQIADAHGFDVTLSEGLEGGARFEFSPE